MALPGTPFFLHVEPTLPRELTRLRELANNLWYSWDRETRELFARLHPALWDAVGQSPKAFLRRVDERRLRQAAGDEDFQRTYHRVLSAFDSYHATGHRNGDTQLESGDLVAYF